MSILGIFFIGFGVSAFLQSRLPRYRRKIFPGRSSWWKKGKVPLGRFSCIAGGISFSMAGLFMTLEGLNLIDMEPALLMLGTIPLFLLMIAGAIADDIRKEPNHPEEPASPSQDGSP